MQYTLTIEHAEVTEETLLRTEGLLGWRLAAAAWPNPWKQGIVAKQLLGGERFSDSELGVAVIHYLFCILIMAEKTPSGFDIESPRKALEEKKKPYVNPHRADPTLPCFQIALQQEEQIAAFLARFRKVP